MMLALLSPSQQIIFLGIKTQPNRLRFRMTYAARRLAISSKQARLVQLKHGSLTLRQLPPAIDTPHGHKVVPKARSTWNFPGNTHLDTFSDTPRTKNRHLGTRTHLGQSRTSGHPDTSRSVTDISGHIPVNHGHLRTPRTHPGQSRTSGHSGHTPVSHGHLGTPDRAADIWAHTSCWHVP